MIFVHIGLHKTGSSTIQRFGLANAALLQRAGVFYPDVEENAFSHAFLRAGFGQEAKGNATGNPAGDRTSAFRDLIASRPDARIFVTAESLCTFDDAGIAALAAALRAHHEVKILIYMRDIVGWTLSLYNQRAKSATCTLDFDRSLEVLGPMGKHSHLDIVRMWGAHFGFDNIRVRTVDRGSLTGGDLIVDVLDALGLPASLMDEAEPGSAKSANTSVRWEAAEFLREFHFALAQAYAGWTREQIAEIEVGRGLRRINAVTGAGRSGDARPKIQKTYRVSRVIQALDGAAAAFGGPPAQYMTPEQHAMLTGVYNQQLAAVRDLVPDAIVADSTAPPPPRRPVLPTLATVPPEIRAAMADAGVNRVAKKRVPPPIRAVLAEVCRRAVV